MTDNSKHYLTDSVVYGPVPSRRYGNSLGINVIARDHKICSFDCNYCQLGWNQNIEKEFLSLKEIEFEIEKYFRDHDEHIDSIVLSGNGEPTLHPDFAKIILNLKKLAPPKTPIICFTNGTRLHIDKVREALSLCSECCVKLDANPQHSNKPLPSWDKTRMLNLMKALPNLVVQSCFYEGKDTNSSEDTIEDWITDLSKLKPIRFDIYTISRKTADPELQPLTKTRLREIQSKMMDKGLQNIRIA